jgi:hypothetical protein
LKAVPWVVTLAALKADWWESSKADQMACLTADEMVLRRAALWVVYWVEMMAALSAGK